MTTTNLTAVAGIASYFELRRAHGDTYYTLQIVLIPEGETADGTTVPSSYYYRRISSVAMRKTWHVMSSSKLLSSPTMSHLSLEQRVAEIFKNISTAFDNAVRNNYVMTGAPIFVEVTKDDMGSVRMAKTPYKLLGRIWKSRKAMGYPEAFVGHLPTMVPSTTPSV